jgi:hypothetical protein
MMASLKENNDGVYDGKLEGNNDGVYDGKLEGNNDVRGTNIYKNQNKFLVSLTRTKKEKKRNEVIILNIQ